MKKLRNAYLYMKKFFKVEKNEYLYIQFIKSVHPWDSNPCGHQSTRLGGDLLNHSDKVSHPHMGLAHYTAKSQLASQSGLFEPLGTEGSLRGLMRVTP